VKIIVNKTRNPIKIPLPGGKFLHLGPGKTGQIAAAALDRPAVRKLLDAGEIAVLGEGEHPQGSVAPGGAPHESTHGHPQNTLVRPKGNR
jgi:hypothetical protein